MSKPSFNALNGTEMVEYIKEKIGKALEDTGEFQANLTFPLFNATYRVSVASYPQQQLTQEPKIKVEGSVLVDNRETKDVLPPDHKTTTVESEFRVDTPDKARDEVGMPIPTPAPGPKGVLVDKGVVRGKVTKKNA